MITRNNSVRLIGHAGSNVAIFNFDSGSKKAALSVATTGTFKNAKGEFVTQTSWHNIIAWGKLAELISKAIHKGDQLVIDGTLSYRSYTSKDGVQKATAEVIVTDFMRLAKADATKHTIKPQDAAVPTPF